MDKQKEIINTIKQSGILPLFYHNDAQTCISVALCLYSAGIRCIEFTNRGTLALQHFKTLIAERNKSMPGLRLGIGTICKAADAEVFIEAGADFLVSPFFDDTLCDVALANKILWIPGCMTPKEIYIAEQAGCSLIKLFPGNVLSPEFLEALIPLFPNLHFLVTGGVDVTEESLKAWFCAGVTAVGIGGKLISKEILLDHNFEKLSDEIKRIIAVIKKINPS